MSIPSVETKIYQAIKARVATLPIIATNEVVWTDGPLPAGKQTYTPDPLKRYLRATWTPNATQRQFIGSKDPPRRPGVLQIDVFGLVTQGSTLAVEVAGQVAEHFPADLVLTFMGAKVRVMKTPSIGPVFVDTHLQVPVLIELETLNL